MIGIIGGTGLYRMAELQVTEVREVSTPFGPPSSPVMLGVLGQRRVAFLALEAQLGYCTIALATDYDCWLDDAAQHVSAEQVIGLFRSNLTHVQRLIAQLTAEYVDDESRPCRRALRSAVVTPREQMTNEQRAVVDFLAA